MLTLFCVRVGIAGGPFPVDVDVGATVGCLKNVVRASSRS